MGIREQLQIKSDIANKQIKKKYAEAEAEATT